MSISFVFDLAAHGTERHGGRCIGDRRALVSVDAVDAAGRRRMA
jgi:hypothetical protein